jgi:hypothetical protein
MSGFASEPLERPFDPAVVAWLSWVLMRDPLP